MVMVSLIENSINIFYCFSSLNYQHLLDNGIIYGGFYVDTRNEKYISQRSLDQMLLVDKHTWAEISVSAVHQSFISILTDTVWTLFVRGWLIAEQRENGAGQRESMWYRPGYYCQTEYLVPSSPHSRPASAELTNVLNLFDSDGDLNNVSWPLGW